MRNLLRPDTPQHLSWKVIQARATVCEGYFPATTEHTLVASGVYTSSILWTNYPGTVAALPVRARPCGTSDDLTEGDWGNCGARAGERIEARYLNGPWPRAKASVFRLPPGGLILDADATDKQEPDVLLLISEQPPVEPDPAS
jgi:hypothetical protein